VAAYQTYTTVDNYLATHAALIAMVIPCLFTLLWAFLLAALAASAGTGVGADVVGNWTLYGFSRSCSAEDNKCQYSFDLNENTGPENYLNCFLTVNGTYQSDFHNQYCNERFVVDGGWNRDDGPKGAFIVVVVTDLAVGANAFFSFKEQDFEDVGIVEYTESSPAYSLSAAWETKRQRDGGDDVAVAAAGVGDYDHDSNEHTISPPLGSQGGVGTGAGELVARQQDDLGKMQIQQLRRSELFSSYFVSHPFTSALLHFPSVWVQPRKVWYDMAWY